MFDKKSASILLEKIGSPDPLFQCLSLERLALPSIFQNYLTTLKMGGKGVDIFN